MYMHNTCTLYMYVHSKFNVHTHSLMCCIYICLYRNQGGELWCLTPDSLLDYKDYQQWLLDCSPSPSPLPPATSQEEFQERSTQAWTYLLLLIVKVRTCMYLAIIYYIIQNFWGILMKYRYYTYLHSVCNTYIIYIRMYIHVCTFY